MITFRQADDRGHYANDWLDSRHSFSFGEYYDPDHMGVSVLRVINDDRVIPGAGFPTHPHKDMEIVSYVLEGALAHKDSMGNGSLIRSGDVQRMSAGSGVTHSEFNPSDTEGTNFLQIWFLPNQKGIEPGYEQKYFSAEDKQGQMKLLVSPDGRDDSIQANSDVLMYGSVLEEGQTVQHETTNDRVIYLHVARGSVKVNGNSLNTGDGATIQNESVINITGASQAETLLFSLPNQPSN